MLPVVAEESSQERTGTRPPKIVNVSVWRNALTRFRWNAAALKCVRKVPGAGIRTQHHQKKT